MLPRTVKKPKKGRTAAPVAAKAPLSDKEFAKLMTDAQNYVDEMQLEAAVLLYEEALESRPDDTRVMDALGEALFNLGQFERAEAVLSESVEKAPKDGYSKWMYLGQMYEGKEAYEAWIRGVALLEEELERLTAASGAAGATAAHDVEVARVRRELSDGYCSLAELYMTDLCDEPEAEELSDKYANLAGTTDSDNPEAYRVLANVRLCQKRKDEAAPLLAKSVELIEQLYPEEEEGAPESAAPSSSKSTAAFAATQAALAAVGDAHAPVDRSIYVPPYDARLQLAKNCMEVELWEPAVTILERLLEEDDSNMEVFYLAGEANFYAGDVETAQERLHTADEVLTAALEQVGGKKYSRGKKSLAAVSSVPAELLEIGIDELLSQRSMIQKLLAVVNGEVAPHEMAPSAAPSAEDETLA